VARAQAGREAGAEEARRKRNPAAARAFEITQINNAISTDPAYIQLQSFEALKVISKDPCGSRLPLMHPVKCQGARRKATGTSI
jgi:hypothetical protein